MSKLFAITIILTGILIGDISCRKPRITKKSSEPKRTQDDALKETQLDTTADRRWILKGFDKNEVSQIKEGEKRWECDDFEVRLYKAPPLVQLYWSNRKDVMTIERYGDDYIQQDFYFTQSIDCHQADVTIKKSLKSGIQTELWKFSDTVLRLTKGADGEIRKEWFDTEDLQSLETYKNNIIAWCAHNDYFVEKGDCMITLA